MDLLREEFKAKLFPLSVTYRCATSIVALAQTIVPDIQARENAPNGTVEDLDTNFDIYKFRNTDMILCRNSAPLIMLAYTLFRSSIPCQVKGRDIGRNLIALIEKCDARSIEHLEEKLEEGCKLECDRLLAKHDDANLDEIKDKYEAVELLLGEMKDTTVGDVIKELKLMFNLGVDKKDDDQKNKAEMQKKKIILTLSTVHRVKGLEAPRVYILNKFLMPSEFAQKDWEKQQEKNIEYVAYTRAEEKLYFISLDKIKVNKVFTGKYSISNGGKRSVSEISWFGH